VTPAFVCQVLKRRKKMPQSKMAEAEAFLAAVAANEHQKQQPPGDSAAVRLG
jgi:hypothetical protein